NTLTQAWQLLIKGKLREKEQRPEWIWKSAYHLAIDLLRHRETGVFAEEVVAVSPDEVMEADPAAEVADREQRAAVERWLNQRIDELTSLEKKLLRLHFWERKSYREIGEVLGLSESTIGSKLSRILSALRAHPGISPEDLL